MAKETKVELVAKEPAASSQQNFQLLMARFDRIEHQNDEQLRLLSAHIQEDEAVHKVVERHSTYFSIFALGIPVGVAAIMHKMGWKGL